jgi:hypothetical protein
MEENPYEPPKVHDPIRVSPWTSWIGWLTLPEWLIILLFVAIIVSLLLPSSQAVHRP